MTRQRALICCLSLSLCIAASLCLHAEVIDRIVAVVEDHIITLSDVHQERDILARLGEKPVDDDKVLILQMIEDYLIETQIADFPEVEVTEAEIDADLARTSASSGPVREAVRRRIRRGRYFDVRFRRFIRPTDEEIRTYYDNIFVPAARDRGTTPLPLLEQVADAVGRNITEERLSHEVGIWLEAIRRRSHIEIFY